MSSDVLVTSIGSFRFYVKDQWWVLVIKIIFFNLTIKLLNLNKMSESIVDLLDNVTSHMLKEIPCGRGTEFFT